MNKKIFKWQILGIVFTIFLGSLLHFLYELSNNLKPIALIAAVNESTWEHLKIGFWPAFIFGIIEYFKHGKRSKNFFFAKMINFYAIPVLITFLFYGYTAFIEDSLFLDILIFIISIIIAYLLSYKILVSEKEFFKNNTLIIILIIIEVLAFSLFSYFPPENFLFLDLVTGQYGIIKLKEVTDWKTYRNENYGFEVKYPSDFIDQEDVASETLLAKTKTDRGSSYYFTIHVIKNYKIDRNISNVEEIKEIDIGGHSGYEYFYIEGAGMSEVALIQVGEDALSISFDCIGNGQNFATDNDRKIYVQDFFNQILSTFKFLE